MSPAFSLAGSGEVRGCACRLYSGYKHTNCMWRDSRSSANGGEGGSEQDWEGSATRRRTLGLLGNGRAKRPSWHETCDTLYGINSTSRVVIFKVTALIDDWWFSGDSDTFKRWWSFYLNWKKSKKKKIFQRLWTSSVSCGQIWRIQFKDSLILPVDRWQEAEPMWPRCPPVAILTCCRSTPPCATENRGWEPKSEASNTFSRHTETQAESVAQLHGRHARPRRRSEVEGTSMFTSSFSFRPHVWFKAHPQCFTLTDVLVWFPLVMLLLWLQVVTFLARLTFCLCFGENSNNPVSAETQPGLIPR